jgi:hypothetical protein
VLLVQGRIFPDWDTREPGVASKLLVKANSSSDSSAPAKVEKNGGVQATWGTVAANLIAKQASCPLSST